LRDADGRPVVGDERDLQVGGADIDPDCEGHAPILTGGAGQCEPKAVESQAAEG
jgi:hypothetical protein